MPIKREDSGGTLHELGPIYRETAAGSLVEIGAIYREEADGSLTLVYASASLVSNCNATDTSTNCGSTFPSSSVEITWDEDGDGSDVDHVEVWKRESGTSSSELVQIPWGTGSYSDVAVSSGVQYFYKVRIQYTDGTHSSFSNEDSVTTC